MKKMNRKGFTLIELLAVIVILAIIVVVTVPTIISTISDARVSSIWNLAGSVANSYDTMAAQDLLATNATLSGVEANNEWKCISELVETDVDGNVVKKLADVLDLSANDVVLDSTTLPSNNGVVVAADGTVTGVTATTCSAIRIKTNGSAEVLLVAKAGGKFDISGKVVYALSSQDAGHQQ